jgi:homoisocitrate dehydrogenase
VIVAGRNWGCGSSREQAATCLKLAGVGAVIAVSFARIFYRNAINNGLPAIVCPPAAAAIAAGQPVTVDLAAGEVRCEAGTFPFAPFPPSVQQILAAGGLIPHLKGERPAETPPEETPTEAAPEGGVPRLCVIPGDGIGQEVVPAAVAVLRAVMPELEIVHAEAGWGTFQRTGTALPAETLAAARACGAVLFGAVSSPSHPVEGYRSPIVALRREMDVFANLRPTRGWPVAGAQPALDLLIVRENTECLYTGRERLEGDTAITERVITRRGSERVARVACRLAVAEGRRVTVVHKANVVRVSDGLWREACLAVAASFPGLPVDEGLVDAVAYHLVRDPGRYQLLLCPNLYGDILSDLAAALGGGLGMAPSLSVGERFALAEPVHGSAPDIAGKGVANPLGAILSVALLARHWWGRPEVGEAIERGVAGALALGLRTADRVGAGAEAVGTAEMERGVMENLGLDETALIC